MRPRASRHPQVLWPLRNCRAADSKVCALQLLVIPMLSASFARGEAAELLAADIISAVIGTLSGGDQPAWCNEP